MIELKLLFLIGVANGTPILIRKIFGNRFRFPIDANLKYFDGRPVFGHSKTIIGFISSLFITAITAVLIGFNLWVGLVVAICSMLGDLFSSFIKRRMNLAPHARATGLDQTPESLFPALVFMFMYDLSLTSAVLVVVLFVVIEIIISRILYRLRIRHQPY